MTLNQPRKTIRETTEEKSCRNEASGSSGAIRSIQLGIRVFGGWRTGLFPVAHFLRQYKHTSGGSSWGSQDQRVLQHPRSPITTSLGG